jgi:hypothetical protein
MQLNNWYLLKVLVMRLNDATINIVNSLKQDFDKFD